MNPIWAWWTEFSFLPKWWRDPFERERLRICSGCGEEVRECMGFVNFEDFMEALKGLRHPADVRETCGYCKEKRLKAEAPKRHGYLEE